MTMTSHLTLRFISFRFVLFCFVGCVFRATEKLPKARVASAYCGCCVAIVINVVVVVVVCCRYWHNKAQQLNLMVV